jgi:hypothetical protein
MRTVRRLAVITISATVSALLPLGLHAQAGQVVGTNGVSSVGNPTGWVRDQQSGAFAQVTTTNPCGLAASGACSGGYGGVGSGSLELSVTGAQGQNGQYPDWGFFYQYAASPTGYGKLADLSALSFDWFRESTGPWTSTSPSADWPYKTPVLRLVLQDKNNQISELIWEGYYNRGVGEALNGSMTTVDKWVRTEGMEDGNFWFNRPPTESGKPNLFVGTDCEDNDFTFWQGGIPGTALTQLLGTGGCLANADANVVGIAVGVGSQWALPYHGFVDNVRMGFGPEGTLALDANFDFVPTTTTPEPTTWALMGAGLLVLGAAARARGRGSRRE